MKIYYGVYLTSLLVINYTCIYIILAEHKDKRQDADINSHVKYGAKGQIKRSYIINGQPLQKDFTPSWDSARLQRRRLALYPEWLSKRIRNFIGKHFPPRFFHAYANQRNSNSRDIIPEALGKETILKKFNNIKKNITPNKGNNYRRSFYIVPDSNSLHTGDNEDLNDGRDDGGISVPSSLSSLGAELVDIPSSFREVSPISLYDYTTDKGNL